jgi:HPt (histidine-containing phosphotransfer) domain-containing protein
MALAEDVVSTLEAGRLATAQALRSLADQVEQLPVQDVGALIASLEPHLTRLRRELDRILGG